MFKLGARDLIDGFGGIAGPLQYGPAAQWRPRPLAERLAAAALLFMAWSGVLAETIYTHGTGLPEDIVSFDSGGEFTVFGLMDFTIINGTGANWAAYTVQLPDAPGQPTGSLVGATLTGGAFSALIVSPDFHYIGAAGGVVTTGSSFSLQFGLNYQRQRVVGVPTLIADDAPVPYEPPPEFVGAPPPDEWVDLGDTDCPGCWPSGPEDPPLPEEWWTIVSFTEVGPDGHLIDRIVGYSNRGEYAVTEGGFTVGRGTYTQTPEEMNQWAHDFTSGQTSSTVPTPLPNGAVLMISGLVVLLVQRRRSGVTSRR